MADPFLTLAGPAPARAEADRWRQVALLSVAAAVGGDDRARVELAAALVALEVDFTVVESYADLQRGVESATRRG